MDRENLDLQQLALRVGYAENNAASPPNGNPCSMNFLAEITSPKLRLPSTLSFWIGLLGVVWREIA
jgi:hypothetical protein